MNEQHMALYRKVLGLFLDLGETTASILESFHALKIKGVRNTGRNSPIQQYLALKGVPALFVVRDSVMIGNDLVQLAPSVAGTTGLGVGLDIRKMSATGAVISDNAYMFFPLKDYPNLGGLYYFSLCFDKGMFKTIDRLAEPSSYRQNIKMTPFEKIIQEDKV